MTLNRSRFGGVAFLLGGVLFVCGYVALNLPEQVTSVLNGWRASGLAAVYVNLQNAMPLRLLAALPLCLPGCLLMAFALRSTADEDRTADRTIVEANPPGASPWSWGSIMTLVCGVGLGLVTAWLMTREPAHPAATYTWAATLVAILLVALQMDLSAQVRWPAAALTRRDQAISAALVLGTMLVVGHDVGHWRWSGTPDEFSFFAAAKGFYDGIIPTHPLSEQGVFGYHPILSSYYQVAFLWLGGANVVAWRLSSVFSLAVAVAATYQLMLRLYDRRRALAAAVLLATSEIAMGYSHLGYNNAQVYGAVMIPLALAAWAAGGVAALPFALTSVFCGLAFYTYFTARLAPVLVLFFWWRAGALSTLWRRRHLAIVVVIAFVLTLIPTLMQLPTTLAQMIRLTGATANQTLGATEAIGFLPRILSADNVGHILSHWLLSIFYPLTSESGHFLLSPVTEFGTSLFWLLGLCSGLLALQRKHLDFLTLAYLGSAFAVGAISPYPHPALTRVMFLAPFTAMLAAVGIERLLRALPSRGAAADRRAWVLTSILVTTIAAANLYRLYSNVYERFYGYGDGTTTEVVRLALALGQPATIVYVQRDPTYMSGTVPDVLKAYAPADDVVYVRPPFTDASLSGLEKVAPPVLFAYDLTKPEERRTIEELVRRRFPQATWHDSAPGRTWNIPHVFVADALDRSAAPSIHEPFLATSTPGNTAAAGGKDEG